MLCGVNNQAAFDAKGMMMGHHTHVVFKLNPSKRSWTTLKTPTKTDPPPFPERYRYIQQALRSHIMAKGNGKRTGHDRSRRDRTLVCIIVVVCTLRADDGDPNPRQ